MTGEDAREDRRERLARAGAWLREQRRLRGFGTAAEFGRALGLEKGLVSNYETGRSEVPDDRAEQIAEVLGMDLIDVRRHLGLWVPDLPEISDEEFNARADRLEQKYADLKQQFARLLETPEGRRRIRHMFAAMDLGPSDDFDVAEDEPRQRKSG